MDTRDEFSIDPSNIKICARCGLRYDWRRSPSSSLKMTYCGSLCERADLGFTLEALLRSERAVRTPVVLPVKPAVPWAA
jgi:hypothetical protein